MKKKIVGSLLASVLCVAMLLSGCGNNEQGGESTNQPGSTADESTKQPGSSEENRENAGSESDGVQMWDGYYSDMSTGLLSFIHFYEDGTYYSFYFGGGVLDAGTWMLLDEEMEYSVDEGPDGDANTLEDNTMATAPQVIEVTSYKSGETIRMAYNEDQICDISLAGMANHRNLIHEADYPYNPSTDELPIELFVFYANNNIGSNFILNHDRTFLDATGDVIATGSWEMLGAGSYSLSFSDNTTATLTVEADGASGTLAKADGSTVALRDTYGEAAEGADVLVLRLTAEDAQVGLPMGVTLRLDCYGDNTCKLIVEVAQVGAELEADQGTYTVSETYQYTFNFENAGEIVGTPDYSSATENSLDIAAVYQADVETEFSGNITPLSINSELKGTYVMGGQN